MRALDGAQILTQEDLELVLKQLTISDDRNFVVALTQQLPHPSQNKDEDAASTFKKLLRETPALRRSSTSKQSQKSRCSGFPALFSHFRKIADLLL
ncbi:hypothetical protein B1F79_03560 [Coxiella-like endosymbiont of Rhipicephalus sanguineus]|nr:hypothetical protein [Coxiella-like endosymbiont of Rhipicephalus sanguineus]